MTGRISVVIPTRNRAGMLVRLLEQLVPRLGDDLGEIIVVDNASSDDTENQVAKFPQVRFVQNLQNHLSAHARQQGWDLATGTYVCFIDDDNLVEEGSLSTLADYLDRHESVGLVGPVQRRWSDGSIWCAGGRINGFLVVSYDHHIDTHKQIIEVDFQPNVFMVRNALREVGVNFDWKNFPHNWSEAEFGNQIRRAGFLVATCVESTVYHDIDYSGYFTRINPTNIFDQAKSRITYRKEYRNDPITWAVFLLIVLPVSVIALVYETRKRVDRKKLLVLYLKGTLCGLISSCEGKQTRSDVADEGTSSPSDLPLNQQGPTTLDATPPRQ
ncbi:MAG: glycosyltransferase family 2 protein [Acidimicrobiaceae bacterium]|nr:glycosyltransferase family 2 protein [Acidimicrobiaceae bacterium]